MFILAQAGMTDRKASEDIEAYLEAHQDNDPVVLKDRVESSTFQVTRNPSRNGGV